ncbi:MAG: NAD(P)-dependent oxidoreductase [Pseudomonadota bacterium]
MKKIAFLGLGAMGSRMAARLIDAGHDVTVWNRSQARTVPFAARGAVVAESPRSAAAKADVVISMVRDDEASRAVWLDKDSGALQSLGAEALAIECSTLSVPYVRDLASEFEQHGRVLVDAPLAGSRPQAESGALIFMVGGSDEAFAKAAAVLEPMAGAVHHAGASGAGAAVKLMVNALFGVQLGAMAELLSLARRVGINPEAAVEIVGATPVCSPAAKLSAGAMLAGTWAPAFPIDLVAKDFALLERTARQVSIDLPLCHRTGEVYARGVDSGFGGDNITGIIQLYSSPA